jgi:uncharacterized membrane protein
VIEEQFQTPDGESDRGRLLAAVAHLSFITGVCVVISCGIFLGARRRSPFVAFHALQSALLEVVAFLGLCVLGGLFFALTRVAGVRGGEEIEMLGSAFLTFAAIAGGLSLFGLHVAAAVAAWRSVAWSVPLVGWIATRLLAKRLTLPTP